MVTVTEFLVRLVESVIELSITVATEIAVQDPLSFVAVVTGTLFFAFSFGIFGYLVLGALAREVGLATPTPGRGARQASGRVPTRPPNPDAERETAGAGSAVEE
jgi:hypothetical protein